MDIIAILLTITHIELPVTTIIHQSDGSTVVKETHPIFLDEDVKQAVNDVLRELIALMPEQDKRTTLNTAR